MSVRGLRDGLKAIVPNWLANRPGLHVGFKFLYSIALMCDVMLEVALEGIRATWPGKGTNTALALVGQGRGILRGENESNSSYATRLRAWLTTWQNAGSAEVLAQQIQAYLGNNPVVRVVDRSGNWVTANADGTTTFQVDTAWDWDSVSNPERAGWWSDLWITVTPSEWPVYAGGLADPAFVAAWGTTTGFGLGHEVPRASVDAILNLVHTWKGAHTWLVAIIWILPANGFGPLFVPGNLGLTGNPDGRWGNWSYNVSGVQRPIRTTAPGLTSGSGSVRYWVPSEGG
jgi:hypothetical protein